MRERPNSGRSVAGTAEIHYGPGEDLETIDFALLREAAQQIDMAAYWLTDRAERPAAALDSLRLAARPLPRPLGRAEARHRDYLFLTWTADGLLRHTVFVGLRADKPAEQVRRE